MNSKINFRQASISALSAFLSALLLGLSGFYQGSLNWIYFTVFFFVMLGMQRFVTGIFDMISPIQAKQADLKFIENKAIVAELFK
jgi:hypothetical protein